MTQPIDAPSDEKTDARKIRSRDSLRTAFLGLLEHKALDQISIREISVEANVGHATFYRHYPSKEDLLDDVAADEIRRMVDLSLPAMDITDSKAACLTQCRYIDQHRTLWTTLLTGGAAPTVKKELLRISREVAAGMPPAPNARLPQELGTALTVTAMIEILTWWLQQNDPLPAETIASYIDQIITSNAFA